MLSLKYNIAHSGRWNRMERRLISWFYIDNCKTKYYIGLSNNQKIVSSLYSMTGYKTA